MRKLFLWFCFLFSICTAAFSQLQNTNFPFFNNMKGARKVFVDTAILKIAPSAAAADADTLYLGAEVNILMQVPYSEVKKNIVSPWLKITYRKGTFTKVAFISAMDIALNERLVSKDVEIIFGVLMNDRRDSVMANETFIINHYLCKAVAFKKGKMIDNLPFYLPKKMSVDSLSVALIEKTKLKKINTAVSLVLNSKKDEEGMYKLNFIVCSANKIVQLPTTHNYLVQLSKNWVNEDLVFHYQHKDFAVISREANTPFGGKTFYKWNGCGYKEL